MKLSYRLQAVASFVTPGYKVADIGTDHGYVPIYLVQEGVSPHAIAMDINKGPILRANEHIIENKLEDFIETRISNGFEELEEGEAECAIVAGMGGELIIRILEEGKNRVKEFKEIILSPHSEISMVRRYLHKSGLKIIDEKMLIDEGKYYTIMKAVHGDDNKYSDTEYMYGAVLINKKDEILRQYLENEYEKLKKIIYKLKENDTDNSKIRLKELEEKVEMVLNIKNRF